MAKKHIAWTFKDDYHKSDDTGCIWRHSSGHGTTKCHYAVNSVDVAKSRTDMHNVDHRQRAVDAGYAAWVKKGDGAKVFEPTTQIKTEVGTKAKEKNKGKDFINKFQGQFYSAMHWLKLDEKGWFVGHKLSGTQAPKNLTGRDSTTFALRNGASGGFGAWYPFFHNHHHMVPQGAVHQYVVEDESSEVMRKRVEIICASKWNINKQENVVILPQEESISAIAGLPAHCPWDMRSHPEYSDSMKDKLKDAKEHLDANIKKGACEEAEGEVAFDLDAAAKSILGQIKKMVPGKQLQAVV
jgi:hypothetical protein